MSTRTSQLQIRVTPAEKETLKSLARAAGRSLSAYVLEQALPSVNRELVVAVEELSAGDGDLSAAGSLWTLLTGLSAEELVSQAARPRLSQLTARTRNVVAALAEAAAHAKGVDPPGWAEDVPPLEQPHFAWSLDSLRPHQLRVAPAPFKRRNLFMDPTRNPGRPAPDRPAMADPAAREALDRLRVLAQELQRSELDVEFYFVAGVVMYQAFRADPPTAHVYALFGPAGEIREALARVAAREGWAHDWLTSSVKAYLTGHAGRFIELPGVRVLAPPIEYALAVKVAALRLGQEAPAVDDVRYLLRAANISDPRAALATVTRYFSERQLASGTMRTFQELLGP